ncbi:hypothetical protein [Aliivibrio sifiae]|uniref:hypothetical protein n=1 Tax=Aliivibrio sifiae TaxID=566293 RepID=UPI003D0FC243
MEVVTVTSIISAIIGALTGSVGAALLGAGIGAGISATLIILHETNRERKNRALDLIQEYTSPSYIQIRNDAGNALKKAFIEIDSPSWDSLYEQLSTEDWQKISKIEHFYKKLNFMLSIKEVDRKYISKYFEKEFWHWQNKYFSKINLASSKPEIGMTLLAEIINKPEVANIISNVAEVEKQA